MIMVWEMYENVKGELHILKFTTLDTFLNQYSTLHWIPSTQLWGLVIKNGFVELDMGCFPTFISSLAFQIMNLKITVTMSLQIFFFNASFPQKLFLSTFCVPDTFLNAENIEVNNGSKTFYLHKANILIKGSRQ